MEFKNPMYHTETVTSPIPELCQKEDVMIGIDEAGRGPVFGPMVYATCFCPISKTEILNNLGFADSKILTESSRNILFDVINENSDTFGWVATACSPLDISTNMLRKEKYNLNLFAHDTTINLIHNVLKQNVKVKEIYIDTVGPAKTYQAKLKTFFPNIKIVVENKADSTYPIVSAASICAKVNRDNLIHHWKFLEDKTFNGELGSGYPNDPKTKDWLVNNCDKVFGYPGLVRFSWSTCVKYLEEHGHEVIWPYEETEKNEKKNSKRKQNQHSGSGQNNTMMDMFHMINAKQGNYSKEEQDMITEKEKLFRTIKLESVTSF